MRSLRSFLDGRWEDGAGQHLASINPATEQVVARGRGLDAAQIDAAAASARSAFEAHWRATTPGERARWLEGIAEAIEENRSLFATVEAQDTGLPITLIDGGHLTRAIDCFRQFARAITLAGNEAYSLENAYTTIVERAPLGVVAILSPWNAPLAVAAMNVAAALASGNCVILKPSERTPLSALLLAEIVQALELPPGILSVVLGDAAVGERLAAHEGVDGLCFVGGLLNGRKVLQSASHSLKRVLLELGGRTPTIVFASADMDQAVDGALLSAFSSNGEVCTAGANILVERAIHRDFAERLAERIANIKVGSPLAAETELGPLVDARHRAHVSNLVDDAIAQGAKLLATSSGTSPPMGFFHPAVLLGDVSPAMAISREEVFGPVAYLSIFDEEHEVAGCESIPKGGLAATIWTGDFTQGLRIARRLDCGGVAINAPFVRDIRAPFGGTGLSGLGRVGGRWSLDAYSEPRTICYPTAPFALPRYGLPHSNGT